MKSLPTIKFFKIGEKTSTINKLRKTIKEVGYTKTTSLVLKKIHDLPKKATYSLSFYLVEKPEFVLWRMKNKTKDFALPCYYPFYYFGINNDGKCYLCCSTWVPESIGNLKSKNVKEIFNSIQAQKIRISMYKGNLKPCKITLCDIVNSRNYKPFSREFVLESNLFTETTKKEIIQKKLVLSDGPARITDGISSACNIRCKFCYNYGCEDIAWDNSLIEKMKNYIINNINNLRLLNFCASGEPFIQKHVKDIIRAGGNSKAVGLYFTSNLNFIDDETKTLLEKANVVQLHASINAANRESYERTIDRGNWNNVMKNLDFFISLRDNGNKSMKIQISMIVNKLNYLDIVDFAKLGLGRRLNKIIIYPMVEHEKNIHLQIGENEISKIKEMLKDKIFEDARIEIQSLSDFVEKRTF